MLVLGRMTCFLHNVDILQRNGVLNTWWSCLFRSLQANGFVFCVSQMAMTFCCQATKILQWPMDNVWLLLHLLLLSNANQKEDVSQSTFLYLSVCGYAWMRRFNVSAAVILVYSFVYLAYPLVCYKLSIWIMKLCKSTCLCHVIWTPLYWKLLSIIISNKLPCNLVLSAR